MIKIKNFFCVIQHLTPLSDYILLKKSSNDTMSVK